MTMKIVELTHQEYREYANKHSYGNFGQTIEYSKLKFNDDKRKLLLGLITITYMELR